MQFLAIKQRNLEKQDFAILICKGYVLLCFMSVIVVTLVISPWFNPMLPVVSFFVVGVAFLFLANNVKRIMLGKSEESFKFDKAAFQC